MITLESPSSIRVQCLFDPTKICPSPEQCGFFKAAQFHQVLRIISNREGKDGSYTAIQLEKLEGRIEKSSAKLYCPNRDTCITIRLDLQPGITQ